MEEVGSLFDSCDKTCSGKVPVSKLILAVKNEIGTSDNDLEQQEKEEILMTVRFLVDPLEQDVQIDKATWLSAWRKQAGYPSPQKCNGNSFKDMAGGDDISLIDTSSEGPGSLDQSKHLYCFSPGSRTSSVEIEPEELLLLKEENQQFQSSIKSLKQQLQKQEDAVAQEQAEKQELEKIFKGENNRLVKQCKFFQETSEELKLSLDVCEREKLDLCESVAKQTVIEKQLRTKIADQNKVIVALNMEVEEFNQEKKHLQLRVLDLQTQLEQQANIHQIVVKEFEEVIQNCIAEKDELSSKITCTLFEKRDLAARLEEFEFPSLDTELALHDFEVEGCNSDSSLPNIDTLYSANILAAGQVKNASTPYSFHEKSAELGSSLLDEMQAVGSFINSDLDSSNDDNYVMGTVDTREMPEVLPNVNCFVEESNSLKPSSSCSTLETRSCILDATDQDRQTKADQSVQTEMHVFSVETQTQGPGCDVSIESPRKIDQSVLTVIMTVETATQTDCERNVTVEEPVMKIDESIQTEVNTSLAETRTMYLIAGSNIGPHMQSASVNDCDRITLNTDMKEHTCKSCKCCINSPRKPMSYALRMEDGHRNFENQTSANPLTAKSWYRFCFALTFTGIFLVLLIFSTVLCTGAILENASESGILSFPYYGSTPSWIKWIVKPLVGINLTKHHPV